MLRIQSRRECPPTGLNPDADAVINAHADAVCLLLFGSV
jgi:hypothetical protein